jgi:tetratricopeptide (TPR) repeat protein
MLETIREYALERFEHLRDREELHGRHAETFLAFAEAVGGLHVFEGSQPLVLERFAQENDNFRAAIGWSLEHRRADLVFRFGSALWLFWVTRGHLGEARPWIDAALADCDPDLPERLWGVFVLGELVKHEGDIERARELKQEALAGSREHGDARWTAALLADLGDLAMWRGEYELARELLEESLELRSRPEARGGLGRTLASLGELALLEGDLEAAESLFRQARDDFFEREPGSVHAGWFAEGLAESLRRRGTTDEADRFFREAMLIYQKLGAQDGVAECLDGLAAVAAPRGEQERAGRLVGAAESLRDEWRANSARPERIPRDVPETARAEGAAMTLDEAVLYALTGLD